MRHVLFRDMVNGGMVWPPEGRGMPRRDTLGYKLLIRNTSIRGL